MIKNAKSKLLGSDTHSLDGDGGSDTHGASLTGSDTLTLDEKQDQTFITGDGLSNTVDNQIMDNTDYDTVYATVSVVVGQADTVIDIIGIITGFNRTGASTDCKMELRRDSVQKVESDINVLSVNQQQKVRVGTTILRETLGIGTYVYDIRARFITGGVTVSMLSAGVYAVANFVNDTHAASLTGSPPTDTHSLGGDNTQKTRSHGIIK